MKKQKFNKAFNVAMATTLVAGAVVAVAPTQAGAALSFLDVKETNSHYANILNLAERGVISGYADGTFRPGDEIKRGNAAKIIAGVLGLDTTNVTNPGFKDVSTQNANYGAIAALANAGIINGFKEDGTYRPNATLTRGQMAKIIANAFELSANGEESPFTDAKNSQYKENIAALFTNKVTTGATATTFDAKSNVTRGQLASFVVRAEAVTPTPTPTPGTGGTVTPTPTPGTGGTVTPTPTPTPTPGTGGTVTPTPTEPTFKEKTETYLDKVISKLNGITVGSTVVTAVGNTITITASTSLSRSQLEGVQLEIMGNFYDLGTRAIVSSVKIGDGIPHAAESLPNVSKRLLAGEIALALELGDAAVAIALADEGDDILTHLKGPYSGPVTLNLLDGSTIQFNLVLTK